MTAAAWALLGTAAVFAVGDWLAVWGARKPAEYVCKPLATAALLATAATLDAQHSDRRWVFVVALACSLAGDVALMLPGDRFIAGLGSFLLAHVAYTVGFALHGGDARAFAIGLAVVVVVTTPLGVRVVRALSSAGRTKLMAPVVVYMLAIGAMVTSAIARGNAYAIAGAGLFFASDALIAEQRFVTPRRHVPVIIMVTYHLGQAGLVLSLLR